MHRTPHEKLTPTLSLCEWAQGSGSVDLHTTNKTTNKRSSGLRDIGTGSMLQKPIRVSLDAADNLVPSFAIVLFIISWDMIKWLNYLNLYSSCTTMETTRTNKNQWWFVWERFLSDLCVYVYVSTHLAATKRAWPSSSTKYQCRVVCIRIIHIHVKGTRCSIARAFSGSIRNPSTTNGELGSRC